MTFNTVLLPIDRMSTNACLPSLSKSYSFYSQKAAKNVEEKYAKGIQNSVSDDSEDDRSLHFIGS
jgi:hypothetical protein